MNLEKSKVMVFNTIILRFRKSKLTFNFGKEVEYYIATSNYLGVVSIRFVLF